MLFDGPPNAPDSGVKEFVMSWNRRIAESNQFFAAMKEAGFLCHHHGACVYSFVLDPEVIRDIIGDAVICSDR